MVKLIAERADVIPLLAEVFRAHGYEGTTLSLISEATGLGKGSLYNFFPGGKEEMAAEVLGHVDAWFAQHVYAPLRRAGDPDRAIVAMFDAVDGYFCSGGRVCLVGAMALDATRDSFAKAIRGYFVGWIDALAAALRRRGDAKAEARRKAEQTVLEIQGALVLTRALDDSGVFTRTLALSRQRLSSP
ncbi:MAG: TetR/AcrR family transcriptional regulator [Xanthobacteraceae bacterium]